MIQKRELKCYSEEKVCIYKYFKKKKKRLHFFVAGLLQKKSISWECCRKY